MALAPPLKRSCCPVRAADKVLLDFLKRPARGVFLLNSQFWLSTALILVGVSFLSTDHYQPWLSFHAEAVAIAGVLLGGATLLTQRQGGWYVPVFWLRWAGCLLLVTVLQLWVLPGIYVGDIVIAGIFMGTLLCAVAIGCHTSRASSGLNLIVFGAVAVASTLSALIGILQWLSLSHFLGAFSVHTDFGERVMGNVAQPNQLGTLLLMGVCAHSYLFDRRHLNRFTYVLLVFLSTLALALTQSRTALLSAIVLTVFVFLFENARLRVQRHWVFFWLLSFWIIFLAIPAMSEFLLISGGRTDPLLNGSGRDILWTQVVHAISQNPWSGYGWNRTGTAQMAAVVDIPNDFTFSYAHNIILDFFVWYGIPIGTGMMGTLAYWFWSRWRRLNTPLGGYAFAALLPLAVHSLLEFPFAYGYFLAVAGIFFGIIETTVCTRQKRLDKLIAGPLVTIVVILGGVSACEYFKIEEDFRVARFANLRIGNMPEGFVYSEIHVLTHMKEMLASSRMQPHSGMDSEELALLKRVAKRFSYGALTYRYVEALALNNRIDESKGELKVLRGLYGPNYYKAVQAKILERGRDEPVLLQLLED